MSPEAGSRQADHRQRRRRGDALLAGDREALAVAAYLGREVRHARQRRHLTQAALAARVGVRQPRISELERGEGADAPLRLWTRIGMALGRPLSVTLSRATGDGRDELPGDQPADGPRDAGHLAAQELVLRLARATGRTGLFELPTRPANPARSVDIGIRDDRRRLLILVEIWNRLDDIGAAARATSLKATQARELAVAIGGDDGPYDVASTWLIVPTAANRALVRRYPEVLRSRFPGSSVRWAAAIQAAAEPPSEPGIAWVDVARGRIVPIRLPG